jgi:hypothetical protein
MKRLTYEGAALKVFSQGVFPVSTLRGALQGRDSFFVDPIVRLELVGRERHDLAVVFYPTKQPPASPQKSLKNSYW